MGRKSKTQLAAEAAIAERERERVAAVAAEAVEAAAPPPEAPATAAPAASAPRDRATAAPASASMREDSTPASCQPIVSTSQQQQHPFSVVLYRHYKPPRDGHDGEVSPGARRMNQLAEAVLHKVSTLDSVPSMLMAMNGEWVLMQREGGRRLKLDNDVYLHVTKSDRTEWDVNALELTLTSSRKSATQLARYVEQLHEEHQNHVNNSLRGNIYFFDHKEYHDFRGSPFEGTSAQARKKFDILNAPKHLSFQQLPFHSNKTFENLCGPEVALIADRVDRFMRGKDKYDQKGVPWQLGFLFSGVSGSGKSSCIRAMANRTGRHIINVNFANIKTVTQLKTLFYSEYINVYRDDESRETVKLRIPIDKRIFVMEEIDALGSAILERGVHNRAGGRGGMPLPLPRLLRTSHGRDDSDDEGLAAGLLAAAAAPSPDIAAPDGGGIDDEEEGGGGPMHDEITLGELLQVLDGNMETPGRIIVITSNRPDVLDEALLRPGRINVNVRFGLASRETIAEMYSKLFDEPLSKGLTADLPDRCLSPAEVMEVMFRNFGSSAKHVDKKVVDELKTRGAVTDMERKRRADTARALQTHLDDLIALKQLQRQQQQQQQGGDGGGGGPGSANISLSPETAAMMRRMQHGGSDV